ncbi:MAG: DUF835 domain-containing protein [Thermoplasmata archaeon]
MSDPRAEPPTAAAPPPDEEAANAYAEGYGEGLREAFREILQHASRGHTAQELRILVESRIARVREDVEVKRRSLLGPPRRPAWGPLLRPPAPRPSPPSWSVVGGAAVAPNAPVDLVPGATVLVREERPGRAVEIVLANLEKFPAILWVSVHAPDDPRVRTDRLRVLRIGPANGQRVGVDGPFGPGEVAGEVRDAAGRAGGALVYLDALEFIATEYGVESAVRFANYLTNLAAESRSALLVSADPHALDPRDQSRLQKAFRVLL